MQPNVVVCRNFLLRTAKVAYFQRKIQSPGISTYPDGSSSQLIRINGVLMYILSIKQF